MKLLFEIKKQSNHPSGKVFLEDLKGDKITVYSGPIEIKVFNAWKSTAFAQRKEPPKTCLGAQSIWNGLSMAYERLDPEKDFVSFQELYGFREVCDLAMYNRGIKMDPVLLFARGGKFYISTKSGEFGPVSPV